MDTRIVVRSPKSLAGINPTLPRLFVKAGDSATRVLIEFLTASIRNRNTRAAYARAIWRFAQACDEAGVRLDQIQPVHVAAYIEQLAAERSAPTTKQHLAAIRMLFDRLVVGQIVRVNPASSVRGPKHVVHVGKTPVLTALETRTLLESIDTGRLIGLRDRALIGTMVFSFARVGAVVAMDCQDVYQQGTRWWIRLHEKGGKAHAVPLHHNAEEFLHAWLAASSLLGQKKLPLFVSFNRRRQPTARRMTRQEVLKMVKRRCRKAGIADSTVCHTFRATGITTYLKNGGTLENAQRIAAHQSPRTTRLYDRTHQEVSLDEIERVVIFGA